MARCSPPAIEKWAPRRQAGARVGEFFVMAGSFSTQIDQNQTGIGLAKRSEKAYIRKYVLKIPHCSNRDAGQW